MAMITQNKEMPYFHCCHQKNVIIRKAKKELVKAVRQLVSKNNIN